jgi:hypothetical protein
MRASPSEALAKVIYCLSSPRHKYKYLALLTSTYHYQVQVKARSEKCLQSDMDCERVVCIDPAKLARNPNPLTLVVSIKRSTETPNFFERPL